MSLPGAYLDEFTEAAGYIEFASIGPVSRRVRRAGDDLMAALQDPGGHVGDEVFPRFEAALAVIAGFAGVPTTHVAPIGSTSSGLFQVAFGLVGRPGNVVVPAHEFPANVYPWLRAESVGGPEVRLVDIPDLRVTAEALDGAIDANTVALSVSLVDFRSGFRVDLEGLRRAAGDALLVVDGIQGVGAVAGGLAPADVLAVGGQKWMRAGFNSGFLAVSDRALDRLAPVLTGWLGVEGGLDTERPAPHAPLDTAARYAMGTPAIVGALQTAAAVEVIGLAGMDAIRRSVIERARIVEDAVRSAGGELLAPWRSDDERAGIVTFRMPGEEAEGSAERLAAAGITVSVRAGWLRASPHATTTPEIGPMLLAALR